MNQSQGHMTDRRVLERVFNAKSVAVVGASANKDKMGYTILSNIIGGGFVGAIYPVNPKADTILDLTCYPSLLEIPDTLDLIVVAVPAPAVPDVLRQASQKGVQGAIIISGGFREIGNDQLEADMLSAAREGGIAVIGPNCQGINYTPNKLCASWPLMTHAGRLGIIAQSGTIAAAMGGWAEAEGLGFSCICALGNMSGVNETDLLEFLGDDPATSVIALNLEGVSDGKRFIEVAGRVAQKKPVVVLKPGRTELGAKAAQSHTKSLAGDDRVFDAVCLKTGLIRVDSIEAFYDACKTLCDLPLLAGPRLQIITSSGGCGILAVDAAVKENLTLPLPDDSILQELKGVLPPQCVVSNPLDLTGDATNERYHDALAVLIKKDYVDGFVVIFGDPIDDVAGVVLDAKTSTRKPLIVCYIGGGEIEKDQTLIMQQAGIPVFTTPERAVKAASILRRRYLVKAKGS